MGKCDQEVGPGAVEWRSVEKPPRDGTAVLLYRSELNYEGLSELRAHVERFEVGWFSDGRWWQAGTGHDAFEDKGFLPDDMLPTYWMWLPAAPDA